MDPFVTYRWRVKWDGRYVAGFHAVSGLPRGAEAQPASALEIPGQSEFPPVTLSRGITTNAAFEAWASSMAPEPERQAMQIELYDEVAELVMRFELRHCRPGNFMALPDLDAAGNTVAIQSLTIEHEGAERDPSVSRTPR